MHPWTKGCQFSSIQRYTYQGEGHKPMKWPTSALDEKERAFLLAAMQGISTSEI